MVLNFDLTPGSFRVKDMFASCTLFMWISKLFPDSKNYHIGYMWMKSSFHMTKLSCPTFFSRNLPSSWHSSLLLLILWGQVTKVTKIYQLLRLGNHESCLRRFFPVCNNDCRLKKVNFMEFFNIIVFFVNISKKWCPKCHIHGKIPWN